MIEFEVIIIKRTKLSSGGNGEKKKPNCQQTVHPMWANTTLKKKRCDNASNDMIKRNFWKASGFTCVTWRTQTPLTW